jgi:outer membrane protein assembly factor BamB
VVDGTVYIGCRDAHVYAIDAANGRKKWDYPTSKGWVISTPAVSGGLVFVGTSDGTRFIGLDAKTGRLKLNLDLKANIFSSPAYADGFVYVGSHNGRLYAIDIARQAIAWEFQTAASLANARKLLTPEGRFDRQAFAPVFHDFQDMYLDFANYVSVGGIMSSPTVDRGVVYVGSLDGTLYALE